MLHPPNAEQQAQLIIEGFKRLSKARNYGQINIVKKLKYLGFKTNRASFSKIINERQVGSKVLLETWKGIQQLVEYELGLSSNGKKFSKKAVHEALTVVPEYGVNIKTPTASFQYHPNGRLSIEQKVEFLSQAQHELIEFGLTLNTFSNYFFTRNEEEFKTPIIQLLERGVNIKCYLLHSDSNEARLYFEDRARAIKEESKSIETIKTVQERLAKVHQEFKAADYKGSFQVYTYKHLPTNHFFVTDGAKRNARMMVSHYIYGERRANCPVIEFDKNNHPKLFKKYWKSLKALTKDASLLQF